MESQELCVVHDITTNTLSFSKHANYQIFDINMIEIQSPFTK